MTAGATLVRDSDAAYEVAETHAKAGGILSAFGLVPPAAGSDGTDIADLARDEDVLLEPGLAQPAAQPLLAHRPGGRAARPRPGRAARW